VRQSGAGAGAAASSPENRDKMEIWLIRHGTTSANLEGRFQGRLDYPLSAQGRREAELLARRLSAVGLELLFSSDLQRAWETAQIIGLEAKLQPVKVPLLRECSWGTVEGMTRAEITILHQPFIEGTDRIKAGLFGGERERKLLARARVFLKRVEHQCTGVHRIALVSHGRFINAMLAAALGLKARQHWPFAPAPASLSVIQNGALPGSFQLELFNDRCHLHESFAP
jgi:broad specificity phosphatase PhoE